MEAAANSEKYRRERDGNLVFEFYFSLTMEIFKNDDLQIK